MAFFTMVNWLSFLISYLLLALIPLHIHTRGGRFYHRSQRSFCRFFCFSMLLARSAVLSSMVTYGPLVNRAGYAIANADAKGSEATNGFRFSVRQ